MKSPTDIGRSLARQWQRSSVRLERLLNPASWPQSLNIGKPSARLFTDNIQAVLRHVENWRSVNMGTVDWEPVSYRAGLSPISLPMRWHLRSPSEWIAATNDPAVSQEYAQLEYLVEQVDSAFHALLVAQRSLWLTKPSEEVVATARLATQLSPGCARGRPLRLLAEHGVDTKFFERNASLLTWLLDERFGGAASEQGLTTFLAQSSSRPKLWIRPHLVCWLTKRTSIGICWCKNEDVLSRSTCQRNKLSALSSSGLERSLYRAAGGGLNSPVILRPPTLKPQSSDIPSLKLPTLIALGGRFSALVCSEPFHLLDETKGDSRFRST